MENTRTTSPATGTNDRRTVVGVFDGPSHAEGALNDLKDAGFSPEQVSVVAQDKAETRGMVENTGMGSGERAGTGALLGGITGGALGWLVGLGALAIPGIGPVVAAGALATTLGGAAVGAVAGGLIGALTSLGVPEEDARGYEDNVRQGSILLTVDAPSVQQGDEAQRIFSQRGGGNVRAYRRGDADAPSTTGGGAVRSEERRG